MQVKLGGEQTVQIGLIVDTVAEVVILTAEVIEPMPDFGARLSTEYIRGMAN